MFLEPRDEVLLREKGFREMKLDTRFILTDIQGHPAVNVVREKPMLGTRHTIWYDRLIEKTDCVM